MVSFMARVYFFILHSRLPECCSVATQPCMSFKISSKVNLFKFWRAPKTGETETREEGNAIRAVDADTDSQKSQQKFEIFLKIINFLWIVCGLWLMLYLDNDL